MRGLKLSDQHPKLVLIINKLTENTIAGKIYWNHIEKNVYQTGELVGYLIEISRQSTQRNVLDAYYVEEEFFILRILRNHNNAPQRPVMETNNLLLAKEIGEFKATSLMEQLYDAAKKSSTGAIVAMNEILNFLLQEKKEN